MAENVEIKGKVSVDTGAAAKQLSDLNKTIADQKKIWKDAEIGSKEYVQAQAKLKESTAQYNKIVEEQNATQTKSSGHFDNLKSKVQGLPGPLGAATEGVGQVNASMMKLVANPVGLFLTAVVGALVLLYKAFTNTFEGGEKMEQVFAGISKVGKVLVDNISNIAGGFAKLISGDFQGAYEQLKGVDCICQKGHLHVGSKKLLNKSDKYDVLMWGSNNIKKYMKIMTV